MILFVYIQVFWVQHFLKGNESISMMLPRMFKKNNFLLLF